MVSGEGDGLGGEDPWYHLVHAASNPLRSASLSRFLPMKPILHTLFWPEAQPSWVGQKATCSGTPWKTYLSSEPAKATTPLQWADLFGFLGAGAPWLQPASLQWPVLMCFSMLMPVASVAAVAALGVLAVATVMRVRMRVPVRVTVRRLRLLIILQLLKQVAHIVEREGPNAQQLVVIGPGLRGLDHLGHCVDGADAVEHRRLLLRIDEVDLVMEDLVREGHLLNGFVDHAFLTHVIEVLLDVLAVDDTENGVDLEARAHLGLGVEGEGNGSGIGHAGGLDHDGVVLIGSC